MASLLYKAAGDSSNFGAEDNSGYSALKGVLYGLGSAGISAAGHIVLNHTLAKDNLLMELNDLRDRRSAVRSWKDKNLAKEYVAKAHNRVQEAAKGLFRRGNRLNIIKQLAKSPGLMIPAAAGIGFAGLSGAIHGKYV